ncbi:MAG: acyltransferase [Nitrospira sp.]|nr:acyltransferase [Nitrospira sp.]
MIVALATAMFLPRAALQETSSTARYPSLDGLRGYLALAVFVSHSSIWYFYLRTGTWEVPPSNVYTQLGQGSVSLFFMITGFLFWSKLLDGRQHLIDWSRLYLSRVLRLGPLYLVAVVCVMLLAFGRAGFHWREAPSVVAEQTAQRLLFTIPGIVPVNGFTETIPLAGVVWSLPYEMVVLCLLASCCLLSSDKPSDSLGDRQSCGCGGPCDGDAAGSASDVVCVCRGICGGRAGAYCCHSAHACPWRVGGRRNSLSGDHVHGVSDGVYDSGSSAAGRQLSYYRLREFSLRHSPTAGVDGVGRNGVWLVSFA